MLHVRASRPARRTLDVSPEASSADERESGFTLVEVIVAMALFMVMAASALGVLGMAVKTTRYETYRTSALNLAARELSIVSDSFTSTTQGPDSIKINQVVNPHPLAGGTEGQPLVVDNVPYTVIRTARWASVGSTAASPCDEGTSSELAYLRVRVEVTWPQKGGEDSSVTIDTILTPLKGTYSEYEGHAGVKVLDANGQPRSNESVTIKGPDGTQTTSTAEDGCALFAFLTPGAYTITLSRAGYVNRSGDPTAQTTAQVQAGQLWRGVIEYDEAASMQVQFFTRSGYALPDPNTFPVSLGNSALQPSGSTVKTGSGNNRTLTNLWPYPSGYQVWAGSCLDADPQYTGDQREMPVAATGGVTSSTTVELAPVEARTRRNEARVLYAYHVADNACPNGLLIRLGTSDSSGRLRTSIPFGTWQIYDSYSLSDEFDLRKGGDPVQATTK